MFKTKIAFLALFIVAFYNGFAQEEGCSKSRVGVVLWEFSIEDDSVFFEYLSQQYGFHFEENWIKEIQERVLSELEANSPETEFVEVSGDAPDNCDYYFAYVIDLIGAGRDIPVPWADGIVQSEYVAYYMSTKFASNPACGIPGYILDIEITDDDRDIYATIKKNIAAFGNIEERIKQWEESNLVPARGPKMKIRNSRDYVSPLEEKRSLDIKIDVTNCKGQTVYDENDGQWVFLPRRTDRGENQLTKLFHQHGGYLTPNVLTLIIIRPVGASATYTLKRGLGADREKVRIKTCGRLEEVVKETEISIYGLEVEVKPDRRQIFTDERTDITLMFNETDPDGNKYPVEGKDLNVKITGIVNGSISPKGEYTTDEYGEVILSYKAGDEDRKIDIVASYQPVKYPDKAEGKATITVKPLEYYATLVLKKKVAKRVVYYKEENKTLDVCNLHTRQEHDLNERIESSIYVTLKLKEVADMPVYNQTWEYYEPINIDLTTFSLNSKNERIDYRNYTGTKCASGGAETTVITRKLLKEREIEMLSLLTKVPWIVTFDNETKKALKIVPSGYDITYEFNEIEDHHSVVWSNSTTEKSESKTKTGKGRLAFGPVEDPKPDPTAISSSQWVQDYVQKEMGVSIPASIAAMIPETDSEELQNEINPDLIVQFGDGKTHFGGDGEKIVHRPNPYGFDRVEETYTWRMTRKKGTQ